MAENILLRALTYRGSYRSAVIKGIIRKFSLLTYKDRLMLNAVERPHYSHCIYEAAKLASLLRHEKVSVFEFGCGGGNGLLAAEKHIEEVQKLFPVQFELYGFDIGSGLPEAKDYRDLMHYFKPGQFRMDRKALQEKLRIAQLVIGDVRETCRSFLEEYKPAPVGFIIVDLDFYSSTKNAFQLLDGDESNFLPRVFMYFDDVIGNNTWLANEYVGEELAIMEFNSEHKTRKITRNKIFDVRYLDQSWPKQIYNLHIFDHSKYVSFVGEEDEMGHESGIRLQQNR